MDRIKILVVDDEEVNLTVIKKTFPEHDITTETSSWKAKDLIEQENYDVFIIDFSMPKIDGLELLEFVKEIYEEKPYTAVLATGYGTSHLFKQDFKDGIFHFYLEKPIELISASRLMEQIIKRVMETKKE